MDLRRSYLLLRTRLGAAVLMLVAMAASSGTAATTYYVATNGNDGAAGTSWATALRTVAAGVAKATTANDQVVLSNGVHKLTGQITLANSVTVRGRTGNRNDVIVDGNFPVTTNRCFYLNNSGAVVADLTISNGCAMRDSPASGGGVYAYVSGSTIRNCLIVGNRCGSYGGGVYLYSGTVLRDSIVTGNANTNGDTAVTPYGGGVSVWTGARVTRCVISNNLLRCAPGVSKGQGGGAYVIGGTIENSELVGNTFTGSGGGAYVIGVGLVTNCLIRGNIPLPSAGGAGVYISDNGTVVDCRIIGNGIEGTPASGGGAFLYRTNARLLDSRVVGNRGATGGGIYIGNSYGACMARGCLISSNFATVSGGGVYIGGIAGGILQSCTIAGNLASNVTGGIYCNSTTGRVHNCIVYTNTSVTGTWAARNWNLAGAGGLGSAFTNCCTEPLTGLPGANNISGNPRFVDAGSGDYRLTLGSPCVNAGVIQSWMNNARDVARKPRIDPFTFLVDIGAYEYMFVQGTMIRLQ